MSPDPRTRLVQAARARHGVVSVQEALALGVSRSQVRTDIERGRWERVVPGVLVSTSAPATWHQSVAVATVSTDGVASHRTAARLHRLDDLAPDSDTEEVIDVTVPRPARRQRGMWVVHQAARLEPGDLVTIDGIPTTGLARTLADLGAVVSDDEVEAAVDEALRRGTSQRWIEQTLVRLDRPGPSGTAALHRVLARADRRGPLPDSLFERLIERAATDAGLPQPERQVRVHDASGRVVAVLDAAWQDRKIGSEAQSERWHGGPRGAQRDLDRHNLLTSLGWRMLYATWRDTKTPAAFVTRLSDLYWGVPAES